VIDIGRLGITYTRRPMLSLTIDWRRTEHGKRWRLGFGIRRPYRYPMGMPPKRRGRVLGITYAWYPQGYEPPSA